MMSYFSRIYKKGIPIRIGSDTNPGGKIVLLELMLMIQFAIAPEEPCLISTI